MSLKKILLVCSVGLSIYSLKTYSQITIGSDLAPKSGAILDMKENNNEGVNSTKGLGMPRVKLTNTKTLDPISDDSESSHISHTGLLVYNVNRKPSLCPGLYVWDGTKWGKLDSPVTSPSPLLKLPNAYIIKPGTSIDIPVIKAYAAWLNLPGLGYIDLTDPANTGGSTAIIPELVWQSSSNLISSVGLSSGLDEGMNSKIRVTTSNNEGNAVVSIKIGGVIRWSWHIWVVNYDPTQKINQNLWGETIFMTRNLGATSDVKNNINNRGLYYIWGRKDPFVGSTTINGNVYATLYNISGGVQSRGALLSTASFYNTVASPSSIFQSSVAWKGSDESNYDNSWGDGCLVPKSPYDPCPEGWRVPHEMVWQGLDATNFTWDATNLGRNHITAGWYPAAGYGFNTVSSQMYSVGTNGWYWTATPGSGSSSSMMSFNSSQLYIPSNVHTNRNVGASVRCVKDWLE